MKFIKVKETYSGYHVIILCRKCETRIDGRKDSVFADLEGKAFEDYYCEKCKLQLEGGIK